MRYTITKVRNGLWVYENEKGVRTEHSTRYDAEKMILDEEHFHTILTKTNNQAFDDCDVKLGTINVKVQRVANNIGRAVWNKTKRPTPTTPNNQADV